MSPWPAALVAAVLAALAAWLLTPQVRAYVPGGVRAGDTVASVRQGSDAGPAGPRVGDPGPRAPWYLRARVHVVLGAAAGAGAAVAAGSVAELVAFGAAGVGCALLVVIDLAARRLPDRLVAASALALFLPLLIAAAGTGDWAAWWRALLAAVVLVAGYFVLAFLSPAGLGLGDVKFAAVVGGFLGWFGWQHVAVGTLLGFVLNAAVAVVVLVSRRGSRSSEVPFGPSMAGGAVLAFLVLG